MANQHKNKMIGFNPDDGTLKPWYEERAAELGVTAKSEYEKALSEHRQRVEGEPCAPICADPA